MTAFLLDTDTASRLLRADRVTVNAMRKSSARDISVSVVTQSELIFGARLRPESPALMSAVRAFLARVTVHAFDETAAEQHAAIRASVRRAGRSAGAFDLMIAAHARALGITLATSDKAIANLGIEGLRVVDWSGRGRA
jgi:tRNA(fMet)-specific endonuclease VapC